MLLSLSVFPLGISFFLLLLWIFWRYLETRPPFEMKFLHVSFIVYIYIYWGLKTKGVLRTRNRCHVYKLHKCSSWFRLEVILPNYKLHNTNPNQQLLEKETFSLTVLDFGSYDTINNGKCLCVMQCTLTL